MFTFKNRFRVFLLVLIIFTSAAITVSAKSKYERITNGIGNVIIGEVLPYNNDEGYRNAVTGSVKLSQLRQWESFYYRAYFSRKISDIDHDVRVLAINFRGIGSRSERFEKEAGGNVITWTLREEDPADYGERTEWSRYFPDFQSSPATFTYYIKPYDCAKPDTFRFGTGEDDITGTMELSAELLEQWKIKYKLTAIDVTMQAFSFTNEGTETTAETKKVIEAKERMDGGYDFKEDEKISRIKTSTIWGNRQLLATGKFRIILD